MNAEVKEKWEEIEEVLDNFSLKYDISEDNSALIEFWTDTAGQDIPIEFDYDGTPEDFVKQFTERAEQYDVDEEVELFVNMRGKNGVPNTVRELIDDCQEAKDTLMKIAKALQEVFAEKKKYIVHFMGYYGYDVEVEARNEDEAVELAEPIFEEAETSEFDFVSNGYDVIES